MSYFFDARQIDRQGRGGKQAHLRPSLRIGRREDTRGYVRETLLYRFGRYRRQHRLFVRYDHLRAQPQQVGFVLSENNQYFRNVISMENVNPL